MSETTTETPATQEPVQTDESLGEGGKAALEAEREARKAADRRARQFERQLEETRKASMSEAEKAITEAEKRGREEAGKAFGERLVRSEFATAAARRNSEFKTAEMLDDLNLARFVGDDGEPDVKAIEKAVERLVPTAGPVSMDLGARGEPAPANNKDQMNQLIRKAVGRA